MSVSAISQALLTTLYMCVATLIGASILAIPVAYARMCRFAVLRFAAAVVIGVIRGVPPLAWLFIVYFSVQVGTYRPSAIVAAVGTLIVVNSAYLAEIYRAGIESVPVGFKEASMSLGLSNSTAMRLVTVPLALRVIVGASSSIAIIIVKDTSIASLIGATELTHYANASVAEGRNGFEYYAVIGGIYLALSLILGATARRRSASSPHPMGV